MLLIVPDPTTSINLASARSSRCELSGLRHVGHSFLNVSAVRMQSSQKRCPQGVMTGITTSPMQIGHCLAMAVACDARRVAMLGGVVEFRLVHSPLCVCVNVNRRTTHRTQVCDQRDTLPLVLFC